MAALIADVQEASAPLTAGAEAALRETHRTALKANRRASAMQSLQDELAQADKDARRIKTREQALEETLLDRERSLLESMNRCRTLDLRLDTEQAAHRAELALWEDEWEQLRGECGTLSEEVLFLRESLAVTRAERASNPSRPRALAQLLLGCGAHCDASYAWRTEAGMRPWPLTR
ncbi:hypothetical protein ACFQ61_09635 [Streptomyces sp. NPDC056500]|uniref:hypothetical protein n=1 Tax=Streptomyces sp. NPDC056500 TaxID=3345840 RepID=UPI0036A773B2